MRVSVCCLLLAVSCGPIARTNPLDPKAPDHIRANGHVTGTIVLEGGGDLATAQLIAATIEGATRYDTTIAPSGAFDIEVPSGSYHLEATAPGFASAFQNSVTVKPGETLDVGVLSLAIAKGRVVGRVLTVGPARADSPAAGASIFLTRKDGAPFSYATLTVPSGQFFLDGVAAGEYVLSANLQDFAPGEAHDTVIVGGDQQATAGDVRLYPASAVVQVEVDSAPAAKFTKSRDVTVLLLAFVERLTEMRVSSDPTFQDAALGDVEYRDFAARVPFTLADADGDRAIYAQFRDDAGHETTVFSAHIVLDRVAPTATRLALAGGENAITTAVISLALEAGDDASGIASYRLSTDGALDGEPSHPLGAAGTTISMVDVESLAAVADGMVTFAVEWTDRAGNVSAPRYLTVLKDTQTPGLAFSVVNNAGVVSSRSVTLDFSLTSTQQNEALTVAIAHSAGETQTAPRVAYSDPLEWTLAAGADGPRDVCVRVFDAAGNASAEVCHGVSLDTTGSLSGRVLYENAPIVGNVPNHSGVDVTLVSPFGAPDLATQSDSTGAFTFTNIPSGAGYKLQLRNLCAVPVDLTGLTVVAGQANDVGTTPLRLFRAYANGSATVDVGDSAGITVAASTGGGTVSATTSSSGGFTVSGLTCGTYDFVATKQSYTSRSFVSLVLTEQSFYDMSSHPLDLRTFPLGAVQLTQSTGDFDVCAAAGPCLALSATKPVDVRLRLNYAGGPDAYYASEDGTLPGSPTWLPFSGALPSLEPFQLDAVAPDGQRTIYVWYRVAGVASPRFAASITLDRAAPTGITVSIDGGAAYTNNAAASVGLTLTAQDALSGVKEVRLSPDDETFNEAPIPFDTSLPFTLTEANGSAATQGTHSVHVQVCDTVGNCSAALNAPSDDIIFDTLPPAGMTITLANGSATTTTTLVALAASGPTGSGAVAVRFGEVDNLSNASYQPLSPPPATSTAFTFLLSPGDGSKTVYAEFKDAAGNTTSTPAQIATVSDQVTLDTQPPGAASVIIASGAAYTNALTVSLSLLSDATATQAQISNCPGFDPVGCNTATYNGVFNPAQTQSINVLAGDGLKFVYARFADAAGNWTSVVNDSITLDTTAPTSPAIAVVESPWASSATVNLQLSAVGADEMYIDGDVIAGAKTKQWIAYAPTAQIQLAPGDCSSANCKTVTVVFRDAALNPSTQAVAYTRLDTGHPSGAIVVRGTDAGDTATNDVNVIVHFQGVSADVVEYRLANDSSFAGASWQSYVPGQDAVWTLTSGDTTKTVWAELRDAAGNVNLTTISDGIDLDTEAPTSPSITIASSATYTGSTGVKLQLSAQGAPSTMQISNCPGFNASSCNTTAWITSSTTYDVPTTNSNWTLFSSDGKKTVYVKFKDTAGNESLVASDDITLDQTPPVINSVTLNGGVYVTGSAAITVATDATDATSGVAQMVLYNDAFYDTEMPEPFASSRPGWTISATPMSTSTVPVSVIVFDGAGNPSSRMTTNIVYDGETPSTPAFALVGNVAGQAELSQTTALTVRITSCGDTAPGAVTHVQISENPSFVGAAWETIDCAATPVDKQITVSSLNGAKNVFVKTRDGALHESTPVSDTITLDTVAPTIISLSISDATALSPGFTKNTTPMLSVTAGDNNNIAGALASMKLYVVNTTGPDCSAIPATSYNVVAASCTGNSCAFVSNIAALAAPSGAKLVYVCVRDLAGNVSATAAQATIYYDAVDPTPPTALTVSSGSRRAYLSWSGANDNESGIARYDITISPPIPSGISGVTGITGVTVSGAQTSTYFDDLLNYNQYSFSVYSVDNAGRRSATAKQSNNNVIGSAGGRVGFTSQALPQVEMFGSSAAIHGEYLYVAQPDTIGSPPTYPNAVSITRCSLVAADCRFPSSWSPPVRLPVPALVSSSTTIVSLSDRIVVGFLDGVGQNFDYAANPVFYECPDTSDCSVSAGFTSFTDNGAPTANFWAYSFAGAGSVMATAYAKGAGQALVVRWCKQSIDGAANACSALNAWKGMSAGTGGRDIAIADSGVSQVDQSPMSAAPDVYVDDRSIHVAWIGLDSSAPGCSSGTPCSRVRYARCQIDSDCDTDSDFSIYGTFDNSIVRNASPSLARTKNNLYLAYLDIGSTTATVASVMLSRCTNFPTCTTWTTPQNVSSVTLSGGTNHKYRARIKLRYGNGALHLAWWDNNTIHHQSCGAPDSSSSDCTTLTNWSGINNLDTDVAVDTVPDFLFAEKNPVLSYVSPNNTVRLRLPFVMSPFSAAFGANKSAVVGSWNPVVWADDQLHHYGSTSAVTSSVTISDPLLASSALALTPATDYYTAARATLGGEKSELSRMGLARIATAVLATPSGFKSISCSAASTDPACAIYSTARSTTKVWSWNSMGGASDLPMTLRACAIDVPSCASASCSISTSGTTCSGAGNFPSGTTTQAANLVVIKNTTSGKDEVHVTHTGTSAGTTTVNHWYIPDASVGSVALVGTTGDTTALPNKPVRTIQFENDKVLDAYVAGGTDRLRMRMEKLSDAPFAWTTATVIPLSTIPISNYAVASVPKSGSGVTLILDYGSSQPVRRVHCDSTLACGSPTSLPLYGGDLYTLSAAAADLAGTGDAHFFSMMRNGRVWVGYCTLGAASCDGSRWTVLPVGYGVGGGDSAASTHISVNAGVINVLYSSLSTVKLSSCRERCYDPGQWSTVKLLDAPSLVAPLHGAHIFDVLNSDGDPDHSTLTIGKLMIGNGGSTATFDFDIDGKAVPQE